MYKNLFVELKIYSEQGQIKTLSSKAKRRFPMMRILKKKCIIFNSAVKSSFEVETRNEKITVLQVP